MLQVQPPPLAEQKLGAESVGGVDHTHMYQVVAMQQEELKQLREEQQRGFLALQQQLEVMQRSMMEQQQISLTEHAREQRILSPLPLPSPLFPYFPILLLLLPLLHHLFFPSPLLLPYPPPPSSSSPSLLPSSPPPPLPPILLLNLYFFPLNPHVPSCIVLDCHLLQSRRWIEC